MSLNFCRLSAFWWERKTRFLLFVCSTRSEPRNLHATIFFDHFGCFGWNLFWYMKGGCTITSFLFCWLLTEVRVVAMGRLCLQSRHPQRFLMCALSLTGPRRCFFSMSCTTFTCTHWHLSKGQNECRLCSDLLMNATFHQGKKAQWDFLALLAFVHLAGEKRSAVLLLLRELWWWWPLLPIPLFSKWPSCALPLQLLGAFHLLTGSRGSSGAHSSVWWYVIWVP